MPSNQNRKKQNSIGLLPPYQYPLRNRNVFFDYKFLQKQYDAIKNKKPFADSYVSKTMRKALKYYNLSNLYDNKLFHNDSDESSRHSINKASLPALIFLLQTYKNKRSIPLYVQYMIISDSIINIAVGKHYGYKDIMDLLFQIRDAFFSLILKKDYSEQEKRLSLSIGIPQEKELYSIYYTNDDETLPHLINDAIKDVHSDQKYSLVEKRYSLFCMVEKKVLLYVKDNMTIPRDKFLPSYVGPLSVKDNFVNTFLDFFHYRQNGYASLSPESVYSSFLITDNLYGWYLIQNLYSLFFTDEQISGCIHEQGFTYPKYYEDFFNY